jgi:hypothetical protein
MMVNEWMRSCVAASAFGLMSLAGMNDAFGGTLYVAGNGVDADNSCLSASSPCREIRRAVAVAAPGDTIRVGAGDYFGFLILNFRGTATYPLTIIGAGARVLADTGGGFPERAIGVSIHNSTHVRIQDLTVLGGYYGSRITDSANISLQSVTIRDSRSRGVSTTGMTGPLSLRGVSVLSAVESSGIYVSLHQGNVSIANSVIRGSGLHGIEVEQFNSSARFELSSTQVAYNRGHGIQLLGRPNGFIRGNTIQSNRGFGIEFLRKTASFWSHTEVTDNYISQLTDGREGIDTTQIASLLEATFMNNTLVHPARGGILYRQSGARCPDSINEVNSDYNRLSYVGLLNGALNQIIPLRDFQVRCGRELNSVLF